MQFVVNKTKKIIPPGFDGLPLYDVIMFFLAQVKKTGLSERASAVSYNFIMAIPPACLFLFSLVPHLPFMQTRQIKRQLHNIIYDIVPAKEYNQNIIHFIDGFLDNARTDLLSTSLILSIFFASNGMMGLMRSFNKNYIGFEKRSELVTRWTAIKLTSIMMGLVVACLILLIMQSFFWRLLGIKNEILLGLINNIRLLFIIALIFYSIAFIYKYAPAIQKRWRLVSPGSVLATALSITSTFIFTFFVTNFGKYNALYGSIGTIIVLMSLIYINSLVLLIGYELNVSIHSIKALAEERIRQESLERVNHQTESTK
ncbi:MAG: YihY/virulence factor BrkB family protein [Flavitalea sp.]